MMTRYVSMTPACTVYRDSSQTALRVASLESKRACPSSQGYSTRHARSAQPALAASESAKTTLT